MTPFEEQAYIHRIRQLEAENAKLKSENRTLLNLIAKLWKRTEKHTL